MSAPSSLWRGDRPLLLASTSNTRRMLLEAAGLPAETEAPGVDERAVEAAVLAEGAGPAEVARRLASAKALAVSRRRPDAIVVGADQTLDCAGELFHKPADAAEARAHLARLAGRTHTLHSAAALARDGAIIGDLVQDARLTLRALSPAAIERYVAVAGTCVTQSVGAYQIEGLGIHLFERIEGDHATILGLPLVPLLAAFRDLQCLDF
jgi:septum formation protein